MDYPDLRVEDCVYFRDALAYLMVWGPTYRAKKNGEIVERLLYGESVQGIMEKTDDGWDWQDVERHRGDSGALEVIAHRISEKLSAPEIRTVKKIARQEKKAQRANGKYGAAIMSILGKKGRWYVQHQMTADELNEAIEWEKKKMRSKKKTSSTE